MLSYLEFAIPAVYHATNFALAPLHRVQKRMLNELIISEKEALFDYSLAPLSCRRDMALMGLLHRINTKSAPKVFDEFIKPTTTCHFPRGLRDPDRRHNRQLYDPNEGIESRQFRRSIFRLVYAYNLLPQIVVDCPVKIFQRYLQYALKSAAR